MKLDKEQFKLKLLNDIKKVYENAELNKELITFEFGTLEIIVDTKDMYKLYGESKNNYNTVKKHCLNVIKEIIEEKRFKVNYNKVFPLLKNKNFGLDKEIGFIREEFTDDLDILYAVDMGDIYRFVTKHDNVDIELLKKSAINNINKIYNVLVKLDEELPIYTLGFTTNVGSSMILSENFIKQINKKVGKSFLFAIPYDGTLVVAENNDKYIDYLNELIKMIPEIDKISNSVYKYKDGKIEYAVKRRILKIIK
ncbi:Protein of unknown function [Caloranaerobacter azorensis DSM 13643]|uniref:DUF1444 family protein n=1 Tax=Caloranaerobacter azorensis DSM 13643 TaxID=1121264 RepID=A0A1M5W6S9_9FIRM|nr:DUF1444 family protein [Caloranaerobacter azorensis]SHH83181.1 Protein of unknown function [Caloranaerobacter azorensis DSM 13643]